MKKNKFLHVILAICVLAALAAGPLPGAAAHTEEGSRDCECNAKYEPTDPEQMFDPPVRMTVFGASAGDSTFTIKLTPAKPSYPMPEGSENGAAIIRISGMEAAAFGTWSYTEPGAYYYKVSVVNDGEAGYTYDAAVYTITDVVKAEGAALTLNRVITNKSNRQVMAMNFMNKYNAGQGAYGSSGSDGAAIVETKTENSRNNNYYYILMALGAALAIAAASDLIIGFMRATIKVRVRV